MQNALLNMDLEEPYDEALKELGFELGKMYETEQDAALGNGGLGRLASCFLDSMATLDLPAWGYGLRYQYGIFKQKIRGGHQVEMPDYWLTLGSPWEVQRTDVVYPVRFFGSVSEYEDEKGNKRRRWEGGDVCMAMAYDNPIPAFDSYNTINLRLWKAAPAKEFDLGEFSEGDYMKAVSERQRAENITNVLYPADHTMQGKELRLRQQYFFVCATLQDIVRRFKKREGWDWSEFSSKNAIQLNDTHPALAVPELMRVLVDEEGLDWATAWSISRGTFSYTNHTVLPEALEKWPVSVLGNMLPRHLEIIYYINHLFLERVKEVFPGDTAKLRSMSIIEEDHGKQVRMANLAIVSSHAVNGVAALHTHLLRTQVFPDFEAMFPDLIQNKTNGVTPRRWMNQCNPGLSALISSTLGSSTWLKELDELQGLRAHADDIDLIRPWMQIKQENKERLAAFVKKEVKVEVPTKGFMYTVFAKRIHEYKRQLMSALHCIHRYYAIKGMTPEERKANVVPRVEFFAGKAAPAYVMAKRIILLINRVAEKVNNDPDVRDYLRVVFIPNYNVTWAERLVPAAEMHQHVSCAGMEASGTSCMKFCMNGGLLIGTNDGANVEIAEEVGVENLFLFGALSHDVDELREHGRKAARKIADVMEEAKHAEEEAGKGGKASAGSGAAAGGAAAGGAGAGDGKALELSDGGEELKAVLEKVRAGEFGPGHDVDPILHVLQPENDYYLVRHDFQGYLDAQRRADELYRDQEAWTRQSILITAGMGTFSTDRTIGQYAKEIWGIEPCRRPEPEPIGRSRARSFPGTDPSLVSGTVATGGGAAAAEGEGDDGLGDGAEDAVAATGRADAGLQF